MTYQCSRRLLVPPALPPSHAHRIGIDVLLATSDHFGHGLFAMVQRVLNQIDFARRRGLEPAVFLGERTFMEPQACEYGINPYHYAPAGDNVWEYWFEQPGNYTPGIATVRGRPVTSVQVTSVETVVEAPVRSYGPLALRARSRRAAHAILGDGGQRLVKQSIRDQAGRLFSAWRRRSRHILGIHVRGTDKVVRAKVPPEAHFPLVDAYLKAHQDALVFVATDDRRYMHRFRRRYGRDGGGASGASGSGRIVSRGDGYDDADWGASADAVHWRAQMKRGERAAASNSGYAKGIQVLLDALLLSKCDFVLISASAVSEFALWVSPHLWTAHLDLQATNRFRGQEMPLWTQHVPGAAGTRSRRRAVATAFCTALHAACANESGKLYAGKYCSRCEPPISSTSLSFRTAVPHGINHLHLRSLPRGS